MGKHKSWVKPKCAMLGSVFVFSLIFSSLISANHVKSLTFSQDVNVAFSFNSALRLSLSDSLYIYNLVPGSTSDSNIIDVIVLTNNTTGYTLNATVGNNTPYNSRSLINPASNNATFDSIAYGSSLANLTTPSTWGYAYLDTTLNNNTNTTWSTYSGLPLHSDTTNIATLKSSYSPVTTATGDLIKFKIAAYAASSQPSGTYNNIINFTLIANPTPSYTVKYDANGGSGTMPDQTIYTGEATKLSSNFFVPPNGYTFAGWNTAANGSGTSYTDQQQVTDLVATGANITLYAQWKQPIMQTMTISDCPATPTIVVDSRDGREYTVQRLADDNCWMLENLALDIANSSVQANMNANTTNATNATLGYLLGTTASRDPNVDASGRYPTAAVGYADNNDYYSIPKVAVNGICNTTAGCVNDPSGGHWTSTSITDITPYNTTSAVQGRIGAFYNYCAASAGSYCYGNGTEYTGSPTTDPDTSTSRDVTEDICPKGWQLPDMDEFLYLYDQYYDYEPNQGFAFQTALSTPLSGGFGQGVVYSQGLDGNFWSSSWVGLYNMKIINVNSQYQYGIDSANRRDLGLSIRCILDSQ